MLPLGVRGIERVRLHTDLTILAKLGCALARSAQCCPSSRTPRERAVASRKSHHAAVPSARRSATTPVDTLLGAERLSQEWLRHQALARHGPDLRLGHYVPAVL